MRILLLVITLFISISSSAKPADWLNNDWAKFIEAAVTENMDRAYGSVGGKFPLVAAYSLLSAGGSSVKPGLQSWLRAKMVDSEGDHRLYQRYHAFYTCLTYGTCEALEELTQNTLTVPAITVNNKFCDEQEVKELRQAGFDGNEISVMCNKPEIETADTSFENKGWTSLGTVDRFCTKELVCGDAIPECTLQLTGKVIQDRRGHNGCVAQGCERGSQYSYPTYTCGAE